MRRRLWPGASLAHGPGRGRRARHRRALAKIFEKESLRVLTAASGTEALEILRREPISVL
jgi:hypothetical protein